MQLEDLQICIPTYNRAGYLSECLESIVRHAPNVSVLVCDNHSTDNTLETVASFVGRISDIQYVSQIENIGAAENLLDVLRRSSKKYIMIMSDDDVVKRSFLHHFTYAMTLNADVVVLGRSDHDARMNFIRPWEYLRNSVAGVGIRREFHSLNHLLDAGGCLAIAFSFISGLIFKRQAWLSAERDLTESGLAQPFQSSLFPQSWIGLYIAFNAGRVLVVDQDIIAARHGNDRVANNDTLARGSIDISEFSVIADNMFEKFPIQCSELRKLIGRHLDRHLFPTYKSVIALRAITDDESWRSFWALAAPLLSWRKKTLAYTPRWLARFILQSKAYLRFAK